MTASLALRNVTSRQLLEIWDPETTALWICRRAEIDEGDEIGFQHMPVGVMNPAQLVFLKSNSTETDMICGVNGGMRFDNEARARH